MIKRVNPPPEDGLQQLAEMLSNDTDKNPQILLGEMKHSRNDITGWFGFAIPSYTELEPLRELAKEVFGRDNVEIDEEPRGLRLRNECYDQMQKALKYKIESAVQVRR